MQQYIDHTLLKPEATSAQVIQLCQEAKQYGFFGVCVNSSFIPLVAKELAGSKVAAVAVVGFPLGAMASEVKAFEAEWCVKHGAREIDMVIAIGALKEKNYDFVRKDIHAVVQASHGALVKVIIETSLLTEDEKRIASALAVEGGAQFVKTSTGFNGGGATVSDIQLMRAVVGPNIGVKASGGVKTREQAMEMIAAGATRIGTSSGILLAQGKTATGGY